MINLTATKDQADFVGLGSKKITQAMASDDKNWIRDLIGDGGVSHETREKLIDVAIELFYRDGIHAVALDSILSRVGTTKTTFYKYFESKDDLVLAALRRRDSWELEWFQNAIESIEETDPCKSLLAVFDVLHLWFTDSKFKELQFINSAAQFPLRNDPVRELAKKQMCTVQSLLYTTAKDSGFSQPEQLSKQLLLLLEGSLSVRFVQGDDTAACTARSLAEMTIENMFDTKHESDR